MRPVNEERRRLLFGLGGLGVSQLVASRISLAESAGTQGYVLGSNEGEHLVHFRDHGQIFIKAGTANGSSNLALGTQQVMAGFVGG